MRRQIMDGLHMAGQKVKEFDDAYAEKLVRVVQGENPGIVRGFGSMAVGMPASWTGNYLEPVGGGKLTAGQQMVNYGAPIASTSLRYGIPAVSAIGLADLIGRSYDALSEVPIFPDQTNEYPN